MFGGPTQLLNSCLKCGMKFDTAEQLATHQKKFCLDADMNNLNQLEKNLFSSASKPSQPRESAKDEYDKHYNKAVQDRERDMQKEIDRIKLEKASIRAKKQQEEEALADLIRESEQKKEKDLRARIEREQIQKELVSLEKAKLSSLEQEKKTQLEKLAADRETLKQKEDHLMKEINRLENDMQTMDRVRDEDIRRQEDALESFKRKGNENIKVGDLLMNEKSEKVAQLKVKREQLELERQKIMGDLEKVKNGDLASLRRSNYGVFAANQMLKDMQGLKNYGIPEMREKIRQDESKLDQLKHSQKGIVTRDHVYADFPYASPPTNVDASYHLPRNSSVPAINKSLIHNNSINQSASHLPTGDILPDQSVLLNDQQIPLEFHKILNKKDFENERLKQELETLKVQNIKTEAAQSNLTLGEMQLRMNGIGSNPQNGFNMYAKTNEFFLQNEARSVDLNEDERMLLNLQAQEVDALRLISQIPIGTDLYRFKMEQYKELSTMRAEAEKIVQEQRLLKLRREFEKQRREEDRKYENEKWVDDQRKNVIATRLKKEIVPVQDNNRYDPVEGFVIHWDYALGIPKRHDSCQIVFGIYINGTEIIPPKLIEPHPCEVDTAVTNRCILGENYALNDIPANSNALVIFEVQILPSKDSTNPRVASYGWSQLDIFDSRRQLRKGKFKVPLYECPTNTNQDIDGIKNLVPVHDGISWIYIRISSPDDPDFDRSQILYPESTHMDYIIPQIHLRNFRPFETQFSQPHPQPQEYAKPQGDQYQDPYDPYSRNPAVSRGQAQRPNNVESFYQPPKQHAKMPLSSQNIEDFNQSTKINDTTMHNKSVRQGPKKAFQIIIHALRNHVARNNLRVSCALLEEADIVMDETGQACAFNSGVHDPNQNGRNATNLSMSTFAIKNKAQGDDIVFEESHKFMKEVDKLFKKSKGQKDIYLMFQVLEKPEPIQHGNSQSMSYKASNMSAYGKQLEYDLFGWLLFKLNKSDGTLSTGKFARNLFSTPLKKPPFDFSNERKTEAKLEFSVHEVEWNNNNNNNTSGQENESDDEEEKSEPRPKRQTTQKPKQKTHNKIDSFSDDNPMPNKGSQQAFIQNTKPQYENKPFERGSGVDFYFDGCRGLPNNVTVTRATVQIIDVNLNALKSPESQLPEFTSPSYDPLFNFKMELRSNTVIAPTAIALISLTTIDEVSNQPKIIGYSAIHLFISNSTKQQPKTNSEMGAILFSGNYQIPIYCQEPKRTQPFTFDDMAQLDRLPGASVLVRINQSAPSNQADPSKKPKSRPQYGAGAYNTSLYPMSSSELQLLDSQQKRQNMTVREVAQALLQGNNIQKNNENEITTWLNEKIQFNPSLGFINMMYFAEYRSDLGFKFSLDGVHNVPTAQPYIGLTMLNPPGGLYANPPDRSQVQMFNKLDWEGPLNSPRFMNGFQYFRGIQPSKNLHIIIDIKAVNPTKKAPQTSTIGWTVLPLFTPDGYFMSGVYQVPLITGEVNQTIVSGLAASNSDPWENIVQQITQKKPLIKWLPNASVMVRLLDCQREGNLERVWDFTRVDSRYIPQNNLSKYIYNANADSKARQGKILKTIIPRKEDVFAFQDKITDTLVKELGL